MSSIRDLKDLKPNEKNPRRISSSQKKLLKDSIERFGDLGGIVYNRKTGKIVSGHQRVDVIESAEIRGDKIITKDGKEFSYREVDWDVKTETEAMIAANRIGGQWDNAKLSEIMSDKEIDLDLEITGFDEDDLKILIGDTGDIEKELEGESEEEEEKDPPPPPLEKIEIDGKNFLNTVFHGDNLELLKKLPKECVDLVYIDPPYFSQRKWETEGTSSHTEGFQDNFKDIHDFISFLRQRFLQIHRVLKPTGSFYLQLDHRAIDYAKVCLDEIFGYGNFKNKLIFKRGTFPALNISPRKYPVMHDFILFYSKTSDHYFDLPFEDYSKEYMKSLKKDKDGRRFSKPSSLAFRGSLPKDHKRRYTYKGITSKKGWLVTKEQMKELDEAGLLMFGEKSINKKTYLDDLRGIPQTDYINVGLVIGDEREGYPTQKPLKLLELFINASSRKGDVVMDCFCGSGTTLAAAKSLGRQYIGMDLNEHAVRTSRNRLEAI